MRVSDIHDIPPEFRDEIEHFFQVYKDLEEKKTETRGFGNRAEAELIIAQARARAEECRHPRSCARCSDRAPAASARATRRRGRPRAMPTALRRRPGAVALLEQPVGVERERREGRVGAEEARDDGEPHPGVLEARLERLDHEPDQERARDVDDEDAPRERARRGGRSARPARSARARRALRRPRFRSRRACAEDTGRRRRSSKPYGRQPSKKPVKRAPKPRRAGRGSREAPDEDRVTAPPSRAVGARDGRGRPLPRDGALARLGRRRRSAPRSSTACTTPSASPRYLLPLVLVGVGALMLVRSELVDLKPFRTGLAVGGVRPA